MISRVRQAWLTALLIAPLCWLSVPASAQSLALSYKLNVSSLSLARVSISNDRCAEFKWAESVATCVRGDALGRFSWSAPADDESKAPSVATMESGAKAEAASPSAHAGEASAAMSDGMNGAAALAPMVARLRPAPARDNVAASLKADATFRLTPRQRLRNTEETLEPYKFTDGALQSRTEKNNFNALGVELLIPFH